MQKPLHISGCTLECFVAYFLENTWFIYFSTVTHVKTFHPKRWRAADVFWSSAWAQSQAAVKAAYVCLRITLAVYFYHPWQCGGYYFHRLCLCVCIYVYVSVCMCIMEPPTPVVAGTATKTVLNTLTGVSEFCQKCPFFRANFTFLSFSNC